MKNPISKTTITTGRFILTISFLLISSNYLGFELNKLPLLDQSSLNSKDIKKLAIPLLLFLSVGHLFNWIHDHSNYITAANEDTIKSIRADLDKINSMIKEMSKTRTPTNDLLMSNISGNFSPALHKIKRPIDRLSRFTKFSEFFLIYIQHLLIPFLGSIWSLYLLYSFLCINT